MSILVFLGPTLPVSEARARLDATYLPPASMGDVLRAVEASPKVIAIVDGLFENVPAVWHKEVLYALSKGVRVFGASSMGALRAAELHAFGMEGIGEIFQAFATGALEDDDEVAVAHADAADGYRCLSDAMVNLRAGLSDARERRVLSRDSHDALLSHAKGLFYVDRSWRALLSAAPRLGVPKEEIEALRAHVRECPIDLKRRDALLLLDRLAKLARDGIEPPKGQVDFERTYAWEQMVKAELAPPDAAPAPPDSPPHGGGQKQAPLL